MKNVERGGVLFRVERKMENGNGKDVNKGRRSTEREWK